MSVVTLDELLTQSTTETRLSDYLEREQVGDAELFRDRFQDRVLYDRAAKSWYVWRGNFWERDTLCEVFNLVSNRIAAEYSQAGTDAIKAGDKDTAKTYMERTKKLLRKRYINDVLETAEKQDGLRISGNEWDTSPMLLGVNNGVIDLTTGELRTGQPREYIRFHSPVDWLGLNHPAPRWELLNQEIFNCEVELIGFMQRAMGYAITGLTNERKFFLPYGVGANGKTVFFETIANVLGDDYAGSIAADALMDTKKDGSGAQPFIHALRGKRLVIASESKEGRRLDTALIKKLTGGDKIATRALYQDVITFAPTHKLFLFTNDLPHVNPEDQAAWDRILPIPFVNRFVDNPQPGEFKKDANLLETLKGEYSGILAWLVRGCLAWQQEGLTPPEIVANAAKAYRAEEDVIADFISECCYVGEDARAGVAQLYERYKQYAQDGGENPMRRKKFVQRIARRFGDPVRESRGMVFRGLGEGTQ
jgi:putative DNA primase/helicase